MCLLTDARCRRTGICLILSLLSSACGADPATALRTPAHFRITDQVIQANLQPFTATIGGIGNALISDGSGFEPVVFRNRLTAIAAATNRIVVDRDSLSRYDSLREGFYDAAEIRIYRIRDGQMRLVRSDRVADGGSHISGWHPAMPQAHLVSPATTSFQFRWDNWVRPNAANYFTVRAVDRSGLMSAPAPAIRVNSPDKPRQATVANALVAFKQGASPPTGTPPPAPRRVSGKIDANGLLTLEWDPVVSTDLAGYAVFRSDDAPKAQHGFYLQLAGRASSSDQHIQAGDMVIVSKKIYAPSRQRLLSNRVWGANGEFLQILPGMIGFFPDEQPDRSWELVPHPSDTPVVEAGETFLRLRLGAGARAELVSYNHSGTTQFWYPVLEKTTYRVEVWLRQQGSGNVRFRLAGFHGTAPNLIEPTIFEVGNGWKKYVAFFTPNVIQSGNRPNAMVLDFSGPATFDVDNFRVFRADTPYLDLTASELETIRASGVSALRTHGPIKTSLRSYNMAQFTNPGGAINSTQKLNTLPQMLRNFRKAGVEPWLQVEYHMDPDEWLGFVEYLAAPYDPAVDTPTAKPWAYKRFSQGQAKPWTEEFDRIYFELSNETWNNLFRPWTFDAMPDTATGKLQSAGRVYGLFQEHVRSAMRGSPYWAAAGLDRKFRFVLGGWGGQGTFSRDAAAASPSSDYLTFADYNGGWDSGEGPPKPDDIGLFNTLAHVNQATIPGAEREVRALAELNAGRKKKLLLGTYEAGPGYALNGLNGARVSEEQGRQQEQVMKSLAAGTATLDSFLARAYRGYTIQNFFTLDSGMLWKSHARWYHGGQAYPSWKAITLFNTEGTGDMLRTETLTTPTATLKGFDRRETVDKAPMIAAYATRKGDRLNVFVLSRKVPDYPVADDDGFTPVTLELPISSAKKLTLHRMSGSPKDNNLLSDNVRVERIELPAEAAKQRFIIDASTGGDARGLQAASTYLYVFEGIESNAR
jgi:hypothetical protein